MTHVTVFTQQVLWLCEQQTYSRTTDSSLRRTYWKKKILPTGTDSWFHAAFYSF